MDIISVNIENCVGCNACIRVCPITDANITKITDEGKIITIIDPNKCINCGECVRECKHDAREYHDDSDLFFEDIYTKKISLLVAPSIKVAFQDTWKEVLNWFYAQGIHNIYDVSLGADICTWAHIEAIDTKKVNKIISQPCPSIVNYIEKHEISLIDNLSPVHSPALCTAVYVKKYLNDTNKLAFLGPCASKKSEFMDTELVSYNVTFSKIKQYFEYKQISFNTPNNNSSFSFTNKQGNFGALYPKPSGLKENLLMHNPYLHVTTCEGTHKVYKKLSEYANMDPQYAADVFDVLSCEEGCNIGIGIGGEVFSPVITTIMDKTKKEAEKRKGMGWALLKNDKQFKEFDKELKLNDFLRTYKDKYTAPVIPSEKSLDEIFNSMLKFSNDERTFDCNACGYSSCKDMATAIYRRLNIKENCIYYTKTKLLDERNKLASAYLSIKDLTEKVDDIVRNLTNDVRTVKTETSIITDNNTKILDITQTINVVIKQMIAAFDDKTKINNDTINEVANALPLIQKIINSLNSTIIKTTTNGDKINTSITDIYNVTVKLADLINEMNTNLLKQ